MKIRIEWKGCPGSLVKGLRGIVSDRSEVFGERGVGVRFVQERSEKRPGFSIVPDEDGATVRYARNCDAFRALGFLIGEVLAGREILEARQECAFDVLGVMVDFSRNGVMTLEAVKALLRCMALMGFNCLQPYMEDTYEVKGEPFFGYLRGGYSQRDLKELDDYAHSLGIEVFLCMQALGHLQQVLQWPAYAELRDVPGVLLADHEPTYALLEKMLVAATAPFRSKRIFAGMDEAYGVGTGRYKKLKGAEGKLPFEVFIGHLQRVTEMCQKLGLKPTTSGDMFFRLGSKGNWYYDLDAVIPPEIVEKIPAEMQLMYWDYYHTDAAFYEDWIGRHRAMGKEPMVFGGTWTWNHFWAQLPFSFRATDALMEACRKTGVRENFCCLWGDDGMQVDIFSALPGLAHYAEHAYVEQIEMGALKRMYAGATGGDFDDYVRASWIDRLNGDADLTRIPDAPSTYLLWDDPMLGMLGPQVRDKKLAGKHAALAKALDAASKRGGKLGRRLAFPAQIARVLSLKIGLRDAISAALKKKDKRAVRLLVKQRVLPLMHEMQELWNLHRAMWMATYKPFGWEVLDGRYGGLMARLATMEGRLVDWLAGEIASIPEMEAKLQRVFAKDTIYSIIGYERAFTPSASK